MEGKKKTGGRNDIRPRVKLSQGTYVGTHRPPTEARPRGFDVFLGIPYALSTGGEGRLRAARPVFVPENENNPAPGVSGHELELLTVSVLPHCYLA